jgi:hypothetical protein
MEASPHGEGEKTNNLSVRTITGYQYAYGAFDAILLSGKPYMQVRNFSPRTQDSYVQQVSLFARHFSKSPEVLGPEEIRSYQVYLVKFQQRYQN